MKKFKLDWDAFDFCIREISERYQDSGIRLIIGVSRGGLVPAVNLSHKLNIPLECLDWQTRDGSNKDINMLLRLKRSYRAHEVLFVDDICDSGKTIEEIQSHFPSAIFTTLVDNIPNKRLVDFAPMVGDPKKWMIFPWES